MAQPAVFEPDAPLSLVIGVTGHRDLRDADVPRLEAALLSSLLEIRHRYPASSAVMLSTLAEGADRLAARVALKAGMRLVVPLPLPLPLYESDFETSASRAEFHDLLGRAAGIIQLPLLDREDAVGRSGPLRDQEYAKAGAYIARHSQVFFALWDGSPVEANKVGGTAQTVRFRLEGVPAPFASKHGALVFPDAAGPVVHLETPRRSNPESGALSCGVSRTLLPASGSAASFDLICRRIDEFNSDARTHRAEVSRVVETSKVQLVNTSAESLPALQQSLPASCRRIMEQYAAADALALHFRMDALTTWKRVSFNVALAAMLFNFHSSFFSVPAAVPASVGSALAAMPWFLIAFLAWSSFTAFWLYGRAARGKFQEKYQDYRALAEALRIHFFWKIAGIDEPVVDSYLRKQRSELEWIRSALLSCDVWVATEGHHGEARLPQRDRLGLVSEWIRVQRRYFASKAKSEAAKLKSETNLIKWLLKGSGGLSVVLAVLLAIPLVVAIRPSSSALWRIVPDSGLHSLFMVVIPMLAVVAGLLHAYGNQLARPEHVRQFGRMSELFYATERELEALPASELDETGVGLVRELGLAALDENADWLILHRERPLEVPPV